MVTSVAGSGKTTTGIEGLYGLLSQQSRLKPSVEQEEIWGKLRRSKGAKLIAYVAYNAAIADELAKRVPQGVSASTCHSLGLKSIRKAYPEAKLDKKKTKTILRECHGRNLAQSLVNRVDTLVSFAKQGLFSVENEEDFERLRIFSLQHGELPGGNFREYDLVKSVLEKSLDLAKFPLYDFDDMIWLPVVKPDKYKLVKYDLMVVDEAQDLNHARQQMILNSAYRIILFGDPNQAIYGFTGADFDAMNNIGSELLISKPGMEFCYLNETRRCSKAVVRLAQRYVPSIVAHGDNPEGKTRNLSEGYRKWLKPSSMILCRNNAPLLRECYRLGALGKKAKILGRNVGNKLIQELRDIGFDKPSRVEKELVWRLNELTSNDKPYEFGETIDRLDCLITFVHDAKSMEGVYQEVADRFSDDIEGDTIRLSTIHKAKGLEANDIFLVRTWLSDIPSRYARTESQLQQEQNLKYVATTRAMDTFNDVDCTSLDDF